MSQNKEGTEGNEKKPGVKIQDLSPKKDAKGGGGRFAQDGGLKSQDGGLKSQDGGVRSADGGVKSDN